MNILILSCGTRNKIVQYFKKELKGGGKVIAADCWNLAPALYEADSYYIVPRITEIGYIETILEICNKEKVTGIFSLIDPELEILALNKKKFEQAGVTVFVSNYDVVRTCFNKVSMYEFCVNNNIKTVATYKNYTEFEEAYKNKEIIFPVFAKPVDGSCSMKAQMIEDDETLRHFCNCESNIMVQRLMKGQEYGIDVYTDLVSKEIISIFIKEKILMRAGETDKSVSVIRQDIFSFVEKFVKILGTTGPIDIDLFEEDGELYISEVNPRFGGGYPHAYECGVNFPEMMLNNLKGKKNAPAIGKYREDIYMMKYLDVRIVDSKRK